MTNKKAGLLGLAGAAVAAIVAPPVGAAAWQTAAGIPVSTPLLNVPALLKGFAIGFGIGSFLFPPEIKGPDGEEDEPTGASATDPVPLVRGRRHVPGNIIYFREGERLRRTYKDFAWTYQAMQVAVCMGHKLRQAKILDTEGRLFEQRCYFGVGKAKAPLAEPAPNQIPAGYYHEWSNKIEAGIRLSQVIWSDGVNPRYFHDWFTDPDIGFLPPEPDGTGGSGSSASGSLGGLFGGAGGGPGSLPTNWFWDIPETFDDWPADLPPLRGVITAASPVWFMGDRAVSVPSMLFDVEVMCDDVEDSAFAWQHIPPAKSIDNGGVNPAHFIWEIFTNKQWGMACPETLLDEASFVACEDYFEAEGYIINPRFVNAEPAKSMLEEILFHVNAMLRPNEAGQLEMVLFRPLNLSPIANAGGTVIPVPGLPLLYLVKDHDVRDIAVESETWTEIDNEFVATFPSIDNAYEDTTIGPLKNEATYQITGNWKTAEFHFEHFTDPTPVKKRLSQIFMLNSRPKIAVTFELDLRFHVVKKGDGLILDSAEFGFDKLLDFDVGGFTQVKGMLFRVMEISEPDIENNSIKIKGGIDMESFYASVYTAPPGGGGGGTSQSTDLTPLDIQAHTDWWPSFSNTEDKSSGFDWNTKLPNAPHARPDSPTTGKPTVFATQIYTAQGNSKQTKVGYHAALGPTVPYFSPSTGLLVEAMPETSACTTKLSTPTFSYVFTSLTSIGGDDFAFSFAETDGSIHQGGKWLYLELRTPLSVDVPILPDAEQFAQPSYAGQYETDANSHWALIFSGVPSNACRTREAGCTEVMRFGAFERMPDQEGRLIYRVGLIQRSANREASQGWMSGSTAWIARIDTTLNKTLGPGGDGTLWAHGFKGLPQVELENDLTGDQAFRLYAKGGGAQGYEDVLEGKVETYGVDGTGFLIPSGKGQTMFSPDTTLIAWRKDGMYTGFGAFNDAYQWQDYSPATSDTWVIEAMPAHRNQFASTYGMLGMGASPSMSAPTGWFPVQQKVPSSYVTWPEESVGPLIETKARISVFVRKRSNGDPIYLRDVVTPEVTQLGAWPRLEYTPTAGDFSDSGYNSGLPDDVEAFHTGLFFVYMRSKRSAGFGPFVDGQPKFVPKAGCLNYHCDLLEYGPPGIIGVFQYPID